MCGRFILGDSNWAAYHDALSILQGVLGNISHNIKPTQSVSMAYMHNDILRADAARWWFVPHWHRGPAADWKATTFNTKIETAHEKPSFRTAWERGRCIIPASGYYEWTGAKGQKTPWFISPQTNLPVFFFAGLYAPLAEGGMSCSILTRPALPELEHLHPRMPVMLSGGELMPWLRHSATGDDLRNHFGLSWSGQMKMHPVRSFGIRDDDPSLIEQDGFGF